MQINYDLQESDQSLSPPPPRIQAARLKVKEEKNNV
jgi:hypothetical protein